MRALTVGRWFSNSRGLYPPSARFEQAQGNVVKKCLLPGSPDLDFAP